MRVESRNIRSEIGWQQELSFKEKNTECLNQDIYKTTKIFLFLNERVWISWLRFFSTKFFMRILDSVSAIMTIGSLFAQVVPYWTI